MELQTTSFPAFVSASGGVSPSAVACEAEAPAETAANPPAVASVSGGVVLQMLHGRGMQRSGGDVYYDAPDIAFAQPALELMAERLGVQWIEDRIAMADREQAAHERLCQFTAGGGVKPGRLSEAAALVAAAVGGGLSGGLNFGAFSLVLAQVQAAMNGTPAGFGVIAATRFSASKAGRQILCNLVGALPGSLAYGVCGAVSATALRPLIDAIALLLSGGHVTPMVPVDPALLYPTPSPLDAHGRPKDGAAYNAELALVAGQRAEVVRCQNEMTNIGRFFNLKYGAPLFSTWHAVRVMYLMSLQLRGRTVAAATGAALSSASSTVASASLLLAGGMDRMQATIALRPDAVLPVFMSRRDLRRVRGEAEPGLCAALRQEFVSAGRAYVKDTGLLRRLLLGVPAAALGVLASTLFINVLVPFGTLLATAASAGTAGALVISGATAAVAFALSYVCVCKTVSRAGTVIRRDPEVLHRQRLTEAFDATVERYVAGHPAAVRRVAGRPAQRWSAWQLRAIFEEMDRMVLRDLDDAVGQKRNAGLDPGADLRLREAWREASTRMQAALPGAGMPAAGSAPARAVAEDAPGDMFSEWL